MKIERIIIFVLFVLLLIPNIASAVPWTLMNGNAGWSPRYLQTSVAMPDGSIVLMGGLVKASSGGPATYQNDVWRSIDKGATWTQITPRAEWSGRIGHSTVVMPDGSIVMMGGMDTYNPIIRNDVWRSIDNGASWTLMTGNAGWSPRISHSSIAMPDGSIVLIGGRDHSGEKKDVWRSIDNGASWTLMTGNAGWSPRFEYNSVAMPDGSIVMMGDDVWRSIDKGATWMPVATVGWPSRNGQSSVVMPDGSIIMMGGLISSAEGFKNDMWRSTDNGVTWTLVTAATEWSPRYYHSSVRMPDGSIVIMGGFGYSGANNDVWQFVPTEFPPRAPAVSFNKRDSAICKSGCWNPGVSAVDSPLLAVVSGLDSDQKVNLQLTYQIVNPSFLQNEKKYVTIKKVGNGVYAVSRELFKVDCLWPGIPEWPSDYKGEKVVEIHFGANLLDPETGNCITQPCTTGSVDYYWYPWVVCPEPTYPTPEFPSAFLPATIIIGFLGAVLLIHRTKEH